MGIKIGLTGNIASGKSQVSKMFEEAGFTVFDADVLAHELYEHDTALVQAIGKAFGPGVVVDGTIDRKTLGAIVFSDAGALRTLDKLVGPALDKYTRAKLEACTNDKIVLDGALLIEWGIQVWFDQLIMVVCDDSIRHERLMNRNNLSEEEAQQRIDSQMPQYNKIPYADIVIENNGSFIDLGQEFSDVLKELDI